MKVFLDANILFSASDAGSATRRLLEELALAHGLVTSAHAWEEARRNLERKRPHLLSGLEGIARLVEITRAFQMPGDLDGTLAEKDVPILAAALGARCTHLWTSDRKHFGSLYGKSMHGVVILSSIQVADQLR